MGTGCAPCAARAAARKAAGEQVYVWTDGTIEIEYPDENIAKAKVMRKGGTYTTRSKVS